MKYFIQHPDVTGRFDPPGENAIRQTPGRAEKAEEADVIFVPVARFDGFRFDERLNEITKPWVLFDWCEFGWDNPMPHSYLWGKGRTGHPAFQNHEWDLFDKFVIDHPPLLTFQRELLAKDRTDKVLPLEYLSWLPEAGGDTKEDFLKRPIEVEFDWGRSHEARMWLHGAIFTWAGRYGYDVVSQFSHLDAALKESGRKWLTVHAPHYARLDVNELQKVVRKSKITIVMPGAGVKTFRHGERCSDAIMAMPMNDLAWTYPWDDTNSVLLSPMNAPELAEEACLDLADFALKRTDLYELYCAAMANAMNYRPEMYCRRHILGNVVKCL